MSLVSIKRVERYAGHPDLWLTTNGRTLFLSAQSAVEIHAGLSELLANPTQLFYENESAKEVRLAAEERDRRIELGRSYAPLPGSSPTRVPKRITPLEDLA